MSRLGSVHAIDTILDRRYWGKMVQLPFVVLKGVGTGNWCVEEANGRQQKRPKCLDKKPNGVFRAKECSRGLMGGGDGVNPRGLGGRDHSDSIQDCSSCCGIY